MNEEALGLFVLGGIILFIGFILLLLVVTYIFQGIAFFKMSKKLQVSNPWFAWIPLANVYLMGKLAGDKIKLGKKIINNLSSVLLWVTVGYSLFNGFITFIYMFIENSIVIYTLTTLQAGVLSLYLIIYYFTIYKIFRVFDEKTAVRNIVLSLVINILQPFLLLYVSGKEPDMEVYSESYEVES